MGMKKKTLKPKEPMTLDKLAATVDKLARMTQDGFARIEEHFFGVEGRMGSIEGSFETLRKQMRLGFQETNLRISKLEGLHERRIAKLERDNEITKTVLTKEFDITYGRK